MDNIVLPINVQLNSNIDNNTLSLELSCSDLRGIPIDTSCNITIDDEIMLAEEIVNGLLSKSIDISMLDDGEHILCVDICAGESSKQKTVKKKIMV